MRAFAHSLLLILLVGTVVSAQNTPDHKISGVVYADYFYNVARDTNFSALSNTALGGAKDLNGFKLRRLYFTFDKTLTESFAMRFRLEVDESANASNGKIGSFVKDAFLKWKGIFKGSDLIFGIQPTPAYETSESIWGYRSIEKTILDLRGIVSSRDQGIALQGTVMDDGMLKYKVMYANGSANNPESNKYKRYYGRLEAAPVENLVVTVYADLNAKSQLSTPSGNVNNNTLTYAGFVGYKQKDAYSFGLEGYMTSTDNGFVQAGAYSSRSALGVSAFGTFVVSPMVTLLARADMFDPNTNSAAKGDSRNYLVAGLDWHPEGNVRIIPNLLYETYESVAGVSVDPSITARVTFTYGF